MYKYKQSIQITAFLLSVFSAVSLYGCSAGVNSEQALLTQQINSSAAETPEINQEVSLSTEAAEVSESAAGTVQTDEEEITAAFSPLSTGLLNPEDFFTDRDLKQNADRNGAETTVLSDDSVIKINKEGTYIISGSAENCTVRVDAGNDAKVQLIMDGADIRNSCTPAVTVVSAKKCFITTAPASVNNIEVREAFTNDGEIKTDAAVFSKTDLVLNGTGTLNIKSSENGITSKDKLKITGGTYNVKSEKDSFEANDAVYICGGSFKIQSSKDGFHCENSDDRSGDIYISDGKFVISAEGDGIQSTAALRIDGGEFDITASEGLEGTYVQINDGTVKISASDDGINAAAKSSLYEVTAEFNGGNITVIMAQGDTDGIDSNGRIIVNGGVIDVSGTSAFDYDVSAEHNGGTVIINGEETDEIPQSIIGHGGGMGGGKPGFRGDRVPPDGGFPEGGFGGRIPPEGEFPGGDSKDRVPPEDGFGNRIPHDGNG